MASQQFYKIENGWPAIDVGALRHPITIQQQGQSSPPVYDAAGRVQNFTTVTTALVAIDAVRGTDVIKGGQTTTQLFLTVVMWYQAGIAPNMRVIGDNGSVYLIQSIENVLEMNAILVLNCLGLGAND